MNLQCFGPYALCGWKVFSAIELPELPSWNTKIPEERGLQVSLGPISNKYKGIGLTVTAEHEVILRISGICGFYLPPSGDEVMIQTEAGADPLVIRNFLYGTVLAALCYMRSLFPLHGSSVLIHGSAIAFSGPSGAGKSTLAMAFAQHGYPLLGDDVCAIDLRSPQSPLLWPAILRVKLLPDAIDNFHLSAATVYTRAAQGKKGHFGITELSVPARVHGPVPLAAVYALDLSNESDVEFTALHGKDRFSFWVQQAHRIEIGYKLGLQNQIFQHISAISQTVPVYRLKRPRALSFLEKTVGLLEEVHEAGYSVSAATA